MPTPKPSAKKVARNFLQRDYLTNRAGFIVYPEACTAYGALRFAGAVRDQELLQKTRRAILGDFDAGSSKNDFDQSPCGFSRPGHCAAGNLSGNGRPALSQTRTRPRRPAMERPIAQRPHPRNPLVGGRCVYDRHPANRGLPRDEGPEYADRAAPSSPPISIGCKKPTACFITARIFRTFGAGATAGLRWRWPKCSVHFLRTTRNTRG